MIANVVAAARRRRPSAAHGECGYGVAGDGSTGAGGSVSGVSGNSGPGSFGIGSVGSIGGVSAGSVCGSVPGIGSSGGAVTTTLCPLCDNLMQGSHHTSSAGTRSSRLNSGAAAG